MTREEAIAVLNMVEAHGSLVIEAKDMAIKALEQDTVSTVSFDFELYKAGLMEMPKGVIDMLDEIKAEIDELDVLKFSSGERIYKDEVLDIIDKYKAESEEHKLWKKKHT